MNTLTKLALGLMGQLNPRPAPGDPVHTIVLPSAAEYDGRPLFETLRRRQSHRDFSSGDLTPRQLSKLLWAAAGINRPELGGRTAPSALNAQEVVVYAAMAQGLYRYSPTTHALEHVAAVDVRRVTGYQDFVDHAPLDLVYVADHDRMKLVPAGQREAFAFAAAGAMAQNVYLCCASEGLGTVIRAWFDHRALAAAMGLGPDEQLLLAQTVGAPAASLA